MKHLKLYESTETGKMWLFPTDDRYEKAINSIPELVATKDFDSILTYNNEFLKSRNYNPNYILLGIVDDSKNWIWYDVSQESFDDIKKDNIKYVGPVDISKDEYNDILVNLNASKYNL